ncbi:dipeptidase [Alkalicoccus urumqiensis]|uniref:Dipeptidase n=1 Tax=Alkalicoccus urumqiensis TaxID=1548213 RepID=A0A2P6MH06_ALKUR|nr:dipeptidase [Alkalicoccus urumqiensis]PRO65562.1 dipeptidase [Alkalicoccus urumqiensis]
MADSVQQYLKENESRLLEQLDAFLAIESISTDSSKKEEMEKAVTFLTDYLNDIGFDRVERHETGGHPLVYAEYMQAEGAPTALFYGHYDVQPADPYELWESAPFSPEVRNGRIYARGASDDKGQVFMHLAVFEAMMKTNGRLPVNVKIIIEGEEEIGSEHLNGYLEQNKDMLQADFSVISDSGMVESGTPTILYGLKGFTGLEVTVHGPSRDLHSGLYGGAVKNPAMALAQLLATMKNEEEEITIDGFHDNIETLTEAERKLMNEAPGENYPVSTGVPETAPEKGYTAKEHTMARPTLEVNGLFGGYQGDGTKTIIPSKATAKLTSRLVPGQDPVHVQNALVHHIETHAPAGVTVDIKREPLSARAYKVDPDHPLLQKAAASYAEAFGREAVFVRMGGSIPVVETIDQLFQVPVVLLGFGTPEDNLHSPNESFPVEHFRLGMDVLAHFYTEAGEK